MRDPERINRILNHIRDLWEMFPDQRFFQLLFNYTRLGTRAKTGIKDPFYYTDDEVEAELRRMIRGVKKENGKH